MKFFSNSKILALLIITSISLAITNKINCAAAESKQQQENINAKEAVLRKIWVNLGNTYNDLLAIKDPQDKKTKNFVKQLQQHIQEAKASLNSFINDKDNLRYHKPLSDYLQDLYETAPMEIPVFAKLRDAIATCPDVAQIMKTHGKTIADLIENIDTPIRKDLQNTLLWIAGARECTDLVELLLILGANPNYPIPDSKFAQDTKNVNKTVTEMLIQHNKTKSLDIIKEYGFNVPAQQQQQQPK